MQNVFKTRIAPLLLLSLLTACADEESTPSNSDAGVDTGSGANDASEDAASPDSDTADGGDAGTDDDAPDAVDDATDASDNDGQQDADGPDEDTGADVEDGSGSEGSADPAPADCEIVSITPATFEVGDEAELELQYFCPDGADRGRKTNFAILLGGSSGSRDRDEDELFVDGGTLITGTWRFPDVEFTAENLGRMELRIEGAPGDEPLVSSVGVSQDIDTIVASGTAPLPGIDLAGATLDVFAVGDADARGSSIAITVDSTGTASVFNANADGSFSGAPASRTLIGWWTFDDSAAQDSSGFMVPVGGIGAAPPLSVFAIGGCGVSRGTLDCGIQPFKAGSVEDPVTLNTDIARFTVDRLLDLESVAPSRAIVGSWGNLLALLVGAPTAGEQGVYLASVSPGGTTLLKLDLPTAALEHILSGAGVARIARTSTVPSEGPAISTEIEVWTHYPGREVGSGETLAGTIDGAGAFTTTLRRQERALWHDFNVHTVRGERGKVGQVVRATVGTERSFFYFPRSGGVSESPIVLNTPDIVREVGTQQHFGLGDGFVFVRGDAGSSNAVQVTMDIAWPEGGDQFSVGAISFDWVIPVDLTDVSELNARPLAFSVPVTTPAGRPDALPVAASPITGSSPSALAVRSSGSGRGTYFIDDGSPPEWVCEDECLSTRGGGLCGSTSHFLTVAAGSSDNTIGWTAQVDDGAAQRLLMPAGNRLAGPISGCYQDNDGGLWLAATTSSNPASTSTDGVTVWRLEPGVERPVEGRTLALPTASAVASLLTPDPIADTRTTEIVTGDPETGRWQAQTLDFARLNDVIESSPRVIDFSSLSSGEPRSTELPDPGFQRPFVAIPASIRFDDTDKAPFSWTSFFFAPGDEGAGECSLTIKGGDVIFSSTSTVSVRDSGLLCGSTPHFLVAGNFGSHSGPVFVAPTDDERGLQLAVGQWRLGEFAFQLQSVPAWADARSRGSDVRVIAADFNGDQLTDLWIEGSGDIESGVLFSDGNGGFATDNPIYVPALGDLENVLGAAPGTAGSTVYGREGLRVQSLRRSTR